MIRLDSTRPLRISEHQKKKLSWHHQRKRKYNENHLETSGGYYYELTPDCNKMTQKKIKMTFLRTSAGEKTALRAKATRKKGSDDSTNPAAIVSLNIRLLRIVDHSNPSVTILRKAYCTLYALVLEYSGSWMLNLYAPALNRGARTSIWTRKEESWSLRKQPRRKVGSRVAT